MSIHGTPKLNSTLPTSTIGNHPSISSTQPIAKTVIPSAASAVSPRRFITLVAVTAPAIAPIPPTPISTA